MPMAETIFEPDIRKISFCCLKIFKQQEKSEYFAKGLGKLIGVAVF
jgi:hypothetical protein